MSDASFEGIRGGDGRRRTWRSDIMTTPPPVYESPRWLPPPIASTEGGRRLVSQTLGRRSGMPWPIFGARARRTQTPLPSGATPLAISARFRVLEAPDAFVGPHARTRRRSTLDPALTARRRHCARPGGRDEHLQKKQNGSVTKKTPPNANEKMSYTPVTSPWGTIALIDVNRLRSYAYSLSRRSTTPCSPRSHSGAHPSPFAHPRPARPVVHTTPPLSPVNNKQNRTRQSL